MHRNLALALTLLACLVLLGLAVLAVGVLAGPPPGWGVPWSTPDAWEKVGALLAGLGQVALALAAIFGAGFALHQYFQQRERELAQRERQNALDRARLQGDVVAALRLRYELAIGHRDEGDLGLELEREAYRSQAFLEGALLADPELAAPSSAGRSPPD